MIEDHTQQSAKERKSAEIAASGLSHKEWYRTIYLNSKHWIELRAAAFEAHGRQCVECRRTGSLDVHHLRYRNIYDVTVADLQPMCRECHDRTHRPAKPRKPKKIPQKSFRPFKIPELPSDLVALLNEEYLWVQQHQRSGRKGMRNAAINRVIARKSKTISAANQEFLRALKSGKKATALKKKLGIKLTARQQRRIEKQQARANRKYAPFICPQLPEMVTVRLNEEYRHIQADFPDKRRAMKNMAVARTLLALDGKLTPEESATLLALKK